MQKCLNSFYRRQCSIQIQIIAWIFSIELEKCTCWKWIKSNGWSIEKTYPFYDGFFLQYTRTKRKNIYHTHTHEHTTLVQQKETLTRCLMTLRLANKNFLIECADSYWKMHDLICMIVAKTRLWIFWIFFHFPFSFRVEFVCSCSLMRVHTTTNNIYAASKLPFSVNRKFRFRCTIEIETIVQ